MPIQMGKVNGMCHGGVPCISKDVLVGCKNGGQLAMILGRSSIDGAPSGTEEMRGAGRQWRGRSSGFDRLEDALPVV